MRIAITDANIFIDLIHVDLHSHLFSLEFEVHTSLEIFDELNESQQNALQTFIKAKELTMHQSDGIKSIEEIKSRKGLSESDKTVLCLAIQLEAFVLSGDGLVRKVSGIKKIEVHGIFWLFDKFLENKLINKKHACQQLKKLMEYNRRLPSDECSKRLDEWS